MPLLIAKEGKPFWIDKMVFYDANGNVIFDPNLTLGSSTNYVNDALTDFNSIVTAESVRCFPPDMPPRLRFGDAP